jgi:hypothetical protein
MDFLANAIFYIVIFTVVGPTIPSWPFLWLIWWAFENAGKPKTPVRAASSPVAQRRSRRGYEMAQWEAKQRLKAEGKNWLS